MLKVAVIGNAGGGKSTLSRHLSAVRSLPYFSIDVMQWRPGWRYVPEGEFVQAHAALLERDTWIIDGFGPWPEIEKRLDLADTIIVVDLPLWRHCWWAGKRQVRSIFLGRADMPEGCSVLPLTLRLPRIIWHVHRVVRPKMLEAIQTHRPGKTVFHLRSPRDIDDFLKRCA